MKNKIICLFILLFFISQFLYSKKIVRVVNFSSDIPALSSFSSSFDPDSYSVKTQIYDSLIHLDMNGKMVPGLALNFRQIEDSSYIIKLRRGVKFHDGGVFTAQDVKYTYETILNPDNKSGTKWVLDSIGQIEIIDRFTLKIKTKYPDGLFFHRLTMFGLISSKKYCQKVGLEMAKKHPIGTGPFKFVEHVPGKHYLLEANKEYWRKKIPHYDQLMFKIIPENKWFEALKNDEVDLVPNLSGKKAVEAAMHVDLNLMKRLVLQSYWVLMKNSGPLKDIRVRQALNYAIDRETLIQRGDHGFGKPQASLGKKGEFGYNSSLKPYPYDLHKAKSLLEEAGHKDGFELKMLAADITEGVAKAIKDDLEKIGVIINLKVVSRPEWAKIVIVGKINGQPYEGDLALNLVDNPIINQAFHSGLFLASQSPWSLLNSPEFDEKYQWALSESKLKDHLERLKELDQYIYDNALMLFTYQKVRTVGYHQRINLPGISINGHIDFFMLSDIKFNE